jgi:Fe-S cluster biosynthesis and repair protein YggX
MKQWQKVEDTAVASTGRIMEQSDNPIIHLLMEIIQRDSLMHHLVQQMVIDSLDNETISLNPDALQRVWDGIEKHIEIEKQTIVMGEEVLQVMQGKKMAIQEYLVKYLLADEEKHNLLLEDLEQVKQGMSPCG